MSIGRCPFWAFLGGDTDTFNYHLPGVCWIGIVLTVG